ncbi:MAG: hypothetical protein KAS32_30255 [Candidatus Peribacteraceae bacterium]|nr:hypothetical protein [Candidatus Peribacteraceae bacterium]
MSDTPGLDELKALNKQLDGLLKDPQPGLHTWCESLLSVCSSIGAYSGNTK